MSGGGQVVCVTGASGYIASWLVKVLLQRGYTVKATVRNLSDPSKVEHLKALEGAMERLRLFEADLVVEGSFDAVIDGCDGVFHTASPVIFDNVNDPQVERVQPAVNGTLNILRSCIKVPSIKRVVLTSSMSAVFCNRNAKTSDVVIDESWYSDPTFCKEIEVELVQPAVDGTLNVLRSCIKVPSIKRVVLTSSISAVFSNRNAKTSDVVIDESWYSDPTFCKETERWYFLSKTLAEEAAWKFAEQYGIDLVVMNPGVTIGPSLLPTLNITFKVFLDFITQGECSCSVEGGCVLVDNRDVAYAHVLAFENALAKGRYCLAAETLTFTEASNILRDLYPTLNIAKR
ncbi:Tetraketide alpha-pyrone reductase 1 [Sesamum alatum]|uniref:Dihydroflavonol 4-reductase n=1 Tax=Sesamum alatum TaxID=300844 RepID=A0AAE1Y8C5_9LAMI|nr:Tetraketide alpha-pyrone reductase 1 [Sesamum alatum]